MLKPALARGELQHLAGAFGEFVKLCHYRGSPNRKRSHIATGEAFPLSTISIRDRGVPGRTLSCM
jgi:hypothetical protein